MDWRNYSRLPADPPYWDALADRIERRRHENRSWLRAAALVAALSAAATLAVFLMPADQPDSFAAALAPSDPTARVMLASDRPPQIAQLLPAYNEEPR